MTYLRAWVEEHGPSSFIQSLQRQRETASAEEIPAIDRYMARREASLREKDPDERDFAIIGERLKERAECAEPLTGDWIQFSDGVYLRIAYCWRDGEGWSGPAQTEDGRGSYYLLTGGSCSMSGSLDPGVPLDALKRTDELRAGSAWIFHHDHAGAGRGRNFRADFRVWEYDGPSADAGYTPRDSSGRRVAV